MNWDQIKNNWTEVSDRIKLTWGKLSEDDITTIAGQRDQFARLLQERYGYEQENAENAVDQFAKRLDIHAEALDSVPVTSNTN
jgi:uncharacterized protein YjbJ (UPF0337 family)